MDKKFNKNISKVEIKEETCPIFSRKKMTEFTALTLIHSLYIDQRGCTSKHTSKYLQDNENKT